MIENGVERKLTDDEKQKLADYAIALDEYFKVVWLFEFCFVYKSKMQAEKWFFALEEIMFESSIGWVSPCEYFLDIASDSLESGHDLHIKI